LGWGQGVKKWGTREWGIRGWHANPQGPPWSAQGILTAIKYLNNIGISHKCYAPVNVKAQEVPMPSSREPDK
jgi:hypothetical protein